MPLRQSSAVDGPAPWRGDRAENPMGSPSIRFFLANGWETTNPRWASLIAVIVFGIAFSAAAPGKQLAINSI